MPTRTRTAVLISGTGSNMATILKAAQDPAYPADIQLVISNRPKAKGLITAESMGVSAVAIDHKDYSSREEFEAVLHKTLKQHDIEFVVCAGFMRVLTSQFVSQWARHLVNIHPSLLPKYKGLHTHKRVIEANDSQHGCTVHWVSEGVDEGEIIDQASLDVLPNDTPETLAQRVQALEHRLYPQALRKALTPN